MEENKIFFLDNQKRIITDIIIINTKTVNQNKIFNSEYISYIIKIVTPFNFWHIKKRYSEIKEIYDYLVKKKPKLRFPAFPPKRLFSKKESTIIERKNSFEEIFFFILQNVEILRYKKLIDFFKIRKTILVIYIKNCFLVNENRLSYELIDDTSSSSSNLSNASNISVIDNKEKTISDTIKIKVDKKKNQNQNQKITENKNSKEEKEIEKEKEIENINEKQDDINNINNNKNENTNKNIDDIINNNININNEEENIYNSKDNKSKIKKIIKSNTNYFKCYEEFKLGSGNYTHRSQVSFFIIKELLRNLRVHSSHIFEIINDFTEYIKLKKKWKKFNEKEITSLFVGINKDELFEDYYQSIFNEEKQQNKNSNSSITEKSTLSSSINSVNNNNIINNDKDLIDKETNNNSKSNLEGLLYYIGKFEENYYGARSCLILLNKIFERDFNPEIDIYIKLFKKLDIKFIKKMNLCKFSSISNCINQKLCFNLINIYTNGYNEKTQIKILNELSVDSNFINKFFDNKIIDNTLYNPYNLE